VGWQEAQLIESTRLGWRSAGADDVVVRRWDADWVVFVRSTAATHWLSPSLAAVFDALRACSRPVSAHELAVAMEIGDDSEAAALKDCLSELRSLGLARREPAAAQ
jgi:hypothetical protein